MSHRFLNWNMPLAASLFTGSQSPRFTPAFGLPLSTPSDVVVRTPSVAGNSPMQIGSPHDKRSPVSAAVSEALALDRACLFLHGKFDDLAKTLNTAEKATISTWLYQFWLFAFMTTKYWGQDYPVWTRDTLDWDTYEGFCRRPSPASPYLFIGSPADAGANEDSPEIRTPSQLCRWSIHLDDEQYVFDVQGAEVNGFGVGSSPASQHQQMEEQLQNALENNDFSNIAADRLPLAVSQIVKGIKRSGNELFLESFAFTIMARNVPLLNDMLNKIIDEYLDVEATHPLHLATSYLDGGSTCCLILDKLCLSLPRLKTHYTNDYGHTVLDNLMMTILKGHSSCSPDILDDTLPRESRFAGVELDLCGRWDADSPCFRLLLQSGKTQPPLSWKHKFCHTSILAVCHCIDTLGSCGLLGPTSGLFVKRCFACGRSLQLSPFHVLALAAFQLARSGCEGEDLFGMIAVLLCMLANRMDPEIRTAVSIDLLLGIDNGASCTHEDLRAIDLAERLPSISGWSAELQRGWYIFCHILRPCDHVGARSCESVQVSEGFGPGSVQDPPFYTRQDFPGNDLEASRNDDTFLGCNEECDEFWYYGNGNEKAFTTSQFDRRSDIGHVWAAVQTELVTYRRINENDPWTSCYFDLDALFTGLQMREAISMPLLDGGMIIPYCRCGRLADPWRPVLPTRIREHYFGNLDVWDRSTFIPVAPRFVI